MTQRTATTRYTYQTLTQSASWSFPDGADVGHAAHLPDLYSAFQHWVDEVDRFDDLDYAQPELVVWKGDHDDITDIYPDFTLTLGPRGGIHRHPC